MPVLVRSGKFTTQMVSNEKERKPIPIKVGLIIEHSPKLAYRPKLISHAISICLMEEV